MARLYTDSTRQLAAAGTGWAVPEEDRPIPAMPPGSAVAGPEDDADVAALPRYGVKPVVMPRRPLC